MESQLQKLRVWPTLRRFPRRAEGTLPRGQRRRFRHYQSNSILVEQLLLLTGFSPREDWLSRIARDSFERTGWRRVDSRRGAPALSPNSSLISSNLDSLRGEPRT